MKNSILHKKIDSLGRFCIPKSLREDWELEEKTTLHIYADKSGIYIKPKRKKEIDTTKIIFERTLDSLGRIKIPQDLRSASGIETNVYLEVTTKENTLCIVAPCKCALCDNRERLTPYMNKYICNDCLDALRKELRFQPC